VGDTGRIEDPAPSSFGGAEIGIPVEVGQSHILMDALQAGNDTQGERAVATEDDRYAPVRSLSFNCIGHRECDSYHGVDVSRGRARDIW
jgi:hypothetical protein